MTRKSSFEFSGDYWQLFKIFITNFLLILVTLFLYVPWAIVNFLKFCCSHTSYKGTYFEFTGTGGEFFLEYFKQVLYGTLIGGLYTFCLIQGHNLVLAHITLAHV